MNENILSGIAELKAFNFGGHVKNIHEITKRPSYMRLKSLWSEMLDFMYFSLPLLLCEWSHTLSMSWINIVNWNEVHWEIVLWVSEK